jgi:hypothetical protein
MEAIRMVWIRMREEYLNRCAIAGFDRRDITKVPATAPFQEEDDHGSISVRRMV